MSGRNSPALEAKDLTKRFGRVEALRGVSLNVAPGEMLGVLGDNGAGKSTLMKILSGFQTPTTGEMFIEGKKVHLQSVNQARSYGIECVYQDLALINTLSVYQNMFLNREVLHSKLPWLNQKEMRRRAAIALDDIGVTVPSLDEEVGMLSGGQRQAIAIARAVADKVRVLLLDEPLAAMGAREQEMIISLLERLKARGDVALIMIAHNYAQTLDVADKIMLIQHGTCTFESQSADTNVMELLDVVKREHAKFHA